jgi:cell division protease FtsH
VNQVIKTIAFWLLIVLSGVLLWKVVQTGGSGGKVPEIAFSDFMQSVDRGDVADVTVSGTDVYGKYRTASGFRTTIPANYPAIFDHLRDHNVTIVVNETGTNSWPNYLLNMSPLILFGALWFVMIRGNSTVQPEEGKEYL